MHPSTRKDSAGFQFRQAVSKSLERKSLEWPLIEIESTPLDMIILDWCLDNHDRLKELGISNISSQPGPTITIFVFDNCALDNENIMEMLLSDKQLSSKLKFYGISASTPTKRFQTQLLMMTSPICLVTKDDQGTGTVVNYKGFITILTCAHVINSSINIRNVQLIESSNKTKNDQLTVIPTATINYGIKDELTSKYPLLIESAKPLGKGFCHPQQDIAVVFPHRFLSLALNAIQGFTWPIQLRMWWFDNNIEYALERKLDFLRDGEVLKNGISTQLTRGYVMSEGFAYNRFYVRSQHVTPFAVPGDSGSLVLNTEGVVVGLVAAITLAQDNNNRYVTEILPVWEFYDWLEETMQYYE
jgi:hypothetical protein